MSSSPESPPHRQWRGILLVAIGGLLGAPARYGVSRALPTGSHAFPTATLVVNLSGALVLGALLEALVRRGADEGRRRSVRLFLGTGFCGAFTTYSTLATDTVNLLRAGRVGVAVAYAVGSVVLGLAATFTGVALAAAHHRRVALPLDPDLSEISEPPPR